MRSPAIEITRIDDGLHARRVPDLDARDLLVRRSEPGKLPRTLLVVPRSFQEHLGRQGPLFEIRQQRARRTTVAKMAVRPPAHGEKGIVIVGLLHHDRRRFGPAMFSLLARAKENGARHLCVVAIEQRLFDSLASDAWLLALAETRLQSGSHPRHAGARVATSGRKRKQGGFDPTAGLLGDSPIMTALRAELADAALLRRPVLLLGESGTGKTIAAKFIHASAGLPDESFSHVNCPTLEKTLYTARMHGAVEKGAGLHNPGREIGDLERAHGGTLFLDEVAELDLAVQAQLLIDVERKQLRPLGDRSRQPHQLSFRVISATNQDLKAARRDGRFRKDLFARLGGISVTMPPLREIPEDIEPIARWYWRAAVAYHNEGRRKSQDLPLPQELLDEFRHYQWPNNVRGLESAIDELTRAAMRTPEVDLVARFRDWAENDGWEAAGAPEVAQLSAIERVDAVLQQALAIVRQSLTDTRIDETTRDLIRAMLQGHARTLRELCHIRTLKAQESLATLRAVENVQKLLVRHAGSGAWKTGQRNGPPRALEREAEVLRAALAELGEVAAARLHERYLCTRKRVLDIDESSRFAELPPDLQRSNREQFHGLLRRFQASGYRLYPARSGGVELPVLHDEEVERLAIEEHERWVAERESANWQLGEVKDVAGKRSPYLRPWDELGEDIRQLDREAVRALPTILAELHIGLWRDDA